MNVAKHSPELRAILHSCELKKCHPKAPSWGPKPEHVLWHPGPWWAASVKFQRRGRGSGVDCLLTRAWALTFSEKHQLCLLGRGNRPGPRIGVVAGGSLHPNTYCYFHWRNTWDPTGPRMEPKSYCGSVWPQRPPSAPVPASRPDVCAEPRLLSHGFNCPVIFSRSWSFTPSLPRGLHRGASGVLRVFPIRQPLQAGPGGLFSQECGWWGSEATLPPWRPRAPEAPDTLPSFPWPLQWCEIRVGK